MRLAAGLWLSVIWLGKPKCFVEEKKMLTLFSLDYRPSSQVGALLHFSLLELGFIFYCTRATAA